MRNALIFFLSKPLNNHIPIKIYRNHKNTLISIQVATNKKIKQFYQIKLNYKGNQRKIKLFCKFLFFLFDKLALQFHSLYPTHE